MSASEEFKEVQREIWGRIEEIVKEHGVSEFMPDEAFASERLKWTYERAFAGVKAKLERLAGGDPTVGERALKERDRLIRAGKLKVV